MVRHMQRNIWNQVDKLFSEPNAAGVQARGSEYHVKKHVAGVKELLAVLCMSNVGSSDACVLFLNSKNSVCAYKGVQGCPPQ